MIDLCIFNRDLYGHISFGIKSVSISGLDSTIQKVITHVLSINATTYFGSIVGSDLLNAAKYSFNTNNTSEFQILFASDLQNILTTIQTNEVNAGIPYEERLKGLELINLLYDKMSGQLAVSLLVTTNSTSRTIKLPVL